MSVTDVVVAVAAVALLAAAGGGLVLIRLPEEELTRTIGGVDSVDVKLAAGRVEIAEKDRSDVRIRATVRRRFGLPRPTVTLAGATLRVDGRSSQLRLRLDLPRGTAVRAEVRTGEVTLWGSDGELVLLTEHGTIAGRELGGATVRARSRTGNVTLHFARPPTEVTAVSETGSVTVLVPDDGPYAVDVEAADPAGVEVDLPARADATRRVRARSRAGRVRVAGQAGPVRI